MDIPPKAFWVVCVVANALNYQSRYRLYWEFRRHMLEDLKTNLLTVEVAYGKQEYAVTGGEKTDKELHVQLRADSVLWHKGASKPMCMRMCMCVQVYSRFLRHCVSLYRECTQRGYERAAGRL